MVIRKRASCCVTNGGEARYKIGGLRALPHGARELEGTPRQVKSQNDMDTHRNDLRLTMGRSCKLEGGSLWSWCVSGRNQMKNVPYQVDLLDADSCTAFRKAEKKSRLFPASEAVSPPEAYNYGIGAAPRAAEFELAKWRLSLLQHWASSTRPISISLRRLTFGLPYCHPVFFHTLASNAGYATTAAHVISGSAFRLQQCGSVWDVSFRVKTWTRRFFNHP